METNSDIFQCSVCSVTITGRHGTFMEHKRNCASSPHPMRPRFTCVLCHKGFHNRTQYNQHIRSCNQHSAFIEHSPCRPERRLLSCVLCRKSFHNRTQYNNHIRSCTHRKNIYQCKQCGKGFGNCQSLRAHRLQCLVNRTTHFRCRLCEQRFENRKLLCRHKRLSHSGYGEGDRWQPDPWQNRDNLKKPWNDASGELADEALLDIYDTHRDIILQKHDLDKTPGDNSSTRKIVQKFNFPLTGNEDPEAIDFKDHLTSIFEREQRAFKVNLAFGIILQHRETGEYRYYVPYKNSHIFDRPLLIHDKKSLSRVVRKIKRKDLEEAITRSRDNTKWFPVFVTNVEYYVYLTSFVLGKKINIPFWLKSKRSIHLCSETNNDSLCAFRCLALHQLIHRNKKKGNIQQSLLKKIKQQRQHELLTVELFKTWIRAQQGEEKKKAKITRENYRGLQVPKDLPLFQRVFNVSVNIFCLQDQGSACVPIFLSTREPVKNGVDKLNLNCYEGHLSYIHNLSTYTKRYTCRHCSQCFKTASNVRRHEKSLACYNRNRIIFPGGYFSPTQTIFEELQDVCNITVPMESRFYDYYAVLDGEAILLKEEITERRNTNWICKHKPISISVCSNVPGYEEPRCFVCYDVEILLQDTVHYLQEIAEKAEKLISTKFRHVIDELQTKINNLQQERIKGCSIHHDEVNDDDDDASPGMMDKLSNPNVFHEMTRDLQDSENISVEYNDWEEEMSDNDILCNNPTSISSQKIIWNSASEEEYKKIRKLYECFTRYCKQMPLLGFNSSNYDLNLWKTCLAQALGIVDEKSSDAFVVKKNNQYICMQNSYLRILDVSQYLPPGTSYAKFLNTFKVSQLKGWFPYEYFDNEKKLMEDRLPPLEAFWSTLKNANTLEDPQRKQFELISRTHPSVSKDKILRMLHMKEVPKTIQENYEVLQETWKEKDMKTLKDLLVWYNNLDVGPFVEAVARLKELYKKEVNVCLFKETISVPGIARKLLFKIAQDNRANFALFDQANSDLHELVKDGICGGPSILFCRYHKAGSTYLRGNESKVCNNCVGYDCNALYLNCIGKEMPVSHFVRWLPDDRDGTFSARKSEKYTVAYDWLDWESHERDTSILHKLNAGKEYRIGPFYIDGFDSSSRTCFEYYGCWHHGHECLKNDAELSKKRYQRTIEREEFIKGQGYDVISMWDCTFRAMCKTNVKLKEFIKQRQHSFSSSHSNSGITTDTLLEAVKSDRFFGVMLVDIQVPKNLHHMFAEFSPLFATCKVPFSKIGKHMQQHAEKHKLSDHDRVLLIGGMKAREILLATPLLRWYLKHGLIVTKLHQAVEYGQKKCFKEFMHKVTCVRRLADNDPELSILGEVWKLVGNSGYGSLLLDRTKHQNCRYIHGEDKALIEVNSDRFLSLSLLPNDNFEILSSKKSIKMDLPTILGFYILQYAKMRMLEFYYDFLDQFVDRSDFELCQMDTDSLYFAISGKSLRDVIKPEKLLDYDHMMNGFCHLDEIESDAVMHFLPRECCLKHARIDKRCPGLFKQEAEGPELISLSSKCYALQLDDNTSHEQFKISSKGLNKHNITNPMETFRSVLQDGESRGVANIGFRARNNTIYTYDQRRLGLSYFYVKREVQSDGINTKPLDLVLKPTARSK